MIRTEGDVWIYSIKQEIISAFLPNRSWLRCFKHKELRKNTSH